MCKKYQVFISSTYLDLKEERETVMKAILNMGCFPAGMEQFPASDFEQFEYIKKIISQSDYYILIVAGRYGTEADDGVSYTEKEYDYAKEIGVPILTFVKKLEEVKLQYVDIQKIEKTNKFREKITKGKMVAFWEDKNELGSQVRDALKYAFDSTPRIGWIRGDAITKLEDYNFIKNSEKGRDIKKPSTFKDKVLLAIYDEYSKDISDYTKNITAEILEIDKDVFKECLVKLESENLIKDVNFVRGGGKIVMATLNNLKITTYGISYLEKNFLSKKILITNYN